MNDSKVNIDSSEQQKFDRIAATWWDPDGESRPLHDLNPARLAYLTERVELKGTKVIDVGCGGGILSESMAAQGALVTGIDVAEKALSVARLHLHESGHQVDYQHSTAESWAEQHPSSVGVVTCMEMLEHVPDPASVVVACANMLVTGGHLFMSTLNRNAAAFAVAILGGEHITRIIPRGTHQYDRFIKPSELCAWLRASGMKAEDITGIHYNPLERTARTGGHIQVNYLIHAVKSD
ncbi:MAG: bifunctional 2-polyprenyl-6-hydroxyphenol methylase/3-demethylubiquinol 3-O-methyltransferase UbiG [Gammaproteobacteria bacterium]|nr:bifunctional 2-polyprenyl-6-hydroxyphenol methylase/3-demethylubiquinol 3-O-methyltransferase UbiG [Gammaproteobacteria bacterium]